MQPASDLSVFEYVWEEECSRPRGMGINGNAVSRLRQARLHSLVRSADSSRGVCCVHGPWLLLICLCSVLRRPRVPSAVLQCWHGSHSERRGPW